LRIVAAVERVYPPPAHEELFMSRFRAHSALAAVAAGLALAVSGVGAVRGGEASDHRERCAAGATAGCAPGDYCRMRLPVTPDRVGVCVKKPDACPMIYQPVCGLNGKTYPNACHAAQAGETVDHDGPCRASPLSP
jgi:hypothetical protein